MIKLKTSEQIETMREGGKILASVLAELKNLATSGVALEEINVRGDRLIREAGAEPSFKNYRPTRSSKPYPASICLSLNDEVVHGLAKGRILKSGDLLKIDAGVFYDGFHTDSAITIPIGKVSKRTYELINIAEESLERAIAMVMPGVMLGDIGYETQKFVREHKFSILKELVGHGVGRELQEEPMVPNFGERGTGEVLKEGMVIAIEPMVAIGESEITLDKDNFTYKMRDGSLAAHFEHTVAVTKNGSQVLTKL